MCVSVYLLLALLDTTDDEDGPTPLSPITLDPITEDTTLWVILFVSMRYNSWLVATRPLVRLILIYPENNKSWRNEKIQGDDTNAVDDRVVF